MQVDVRPIHLYRGDNNKMIFTILELTNPSEPYNPSSNPRVAVDISGWTFRMQVRTSSTMDAPLLIDVSTNDRIVLTDPTEGELTIELIPSDTEDLKLPDDEFDAVYDLEANTGTQIITVSRGPAYIRRDVTQ